MKPEPRLGLFKLALFLLLGSTGSHALGQAREPVLSLAKKEKPALLETLKTLVSIESGSRDDEGLAKLAGLIAGRLKELDVQVELVEPSDVYKIEDTPETIGKMVRATFTGTGTTKILLIAHMDTVYPRGMLTQQPFRVQGDRAYGLGIADDKQGIAVIMHTLAILKAMDFRELHAHRTHQRRRGAELARFAQPTDQARRRARRNFLR
jgi:glutamate carboxypeptidase